MKAFPFRLQRFSTRGLALTAGLTASLGMTVTHAVHAQTTSATARITAITAKDDHSDFEVVFDKPVCTARTPATHAQVLKARSTNHAVLYSALMAAFLSNLPVRVQTSDDSGCHILSLRVSR
ncbi:MAG TPA: hypothetical protein VFZ61_21795 [Polyangiales bacterium]